MRNRGHFLSPTLVVGANNEGRAITEQFRNWGTSGLNIIGFIDETLSPGNKVDHNYSILGGLQDLDRIVEENEIEEIIIAPTSLTRDQLLCIFQDYSTSPDVKLRLSSGLLRYNHGLRVKEIAFVPLIELKEGRISGMEAFLKFLLDYGLTIPVLVLTLPILLIISIAIKIDSPGPIIFRRRVMGLNGIQFNAFKFRTMCLEANEILNEHPDLQAELAENFKLKDDPRVTRVGAFLRKWSLDELPQLINVIFGQMSLVGPRMISPPEMEKYGHWGMNLLTVRPGITGMWQVSGRSDVTYEDRVRLDMYYIRNWTVWLDIFLLYKTPLAVIQKKGAY
jgi:exopolysaccharide biosynthesis polyprenyl glycosylphosphotransferase